MGSIIQVEGCHDLHVQDSGGGVKFCEFVGTMLVFIIKLCVTKLAYPYYYWPTFGRWVGELGHLRKSCSA